jgi:hypothetical protein
VERFKHMNGRSDLSGLWSHGGDSASYQVKSTSRQSLTRSIYGDCKNQVSAFMKGMEIVLTFILT